MIVELCRDFAGIVLQTLGALKEVCKLPAVFTLISCNRGVLHDRMVYGGPTVNRNARAVNGLRNDTEYQ